PARRDAVGGRALRPERPRAAGLPGLGGRVHRARARVLSRMRTVVLSGSLAATSEMWDAQADALRDFDVVRIEHPGHGGEPLIELHDVGELARRVLETVPSDRFSFVG